MIITSKNNPLIKETASLKEKKGRKELCAFLVEGHKMSLECLKSPLQIEKIFYTEAYAKTCEGVFPEDICVTVSEDVMKFLCDEKTPQGIICRVKIPTASKFAPKGKCLLLDGVADPGNMGAIIRSANAAGFKTLFLTEDCTDPFSPKSVRASMSGLFSVEIVFIQREQTAEIFADFPIFVADMAGENVFTVTPPKAYALAIGNEGRGLSDTVKKAATKVVSIPMQGGQESLNASVAAGIAMYILSRSEFNEIII